MYTYFWIETITLHLVVIVIIYFRLFVWYCFYVFSFLCARWHCNFPWWDESSTLWSLGHVVLPSVPGMLMLETGVQHGTKQCAKIMDPLSSLFCLQWVTEDSKPSRRTRGCSQGNLQVRHFLFWWIASHIVLKCFSVAPKATATNRYQYSNPDQISFLYSDICSQWSV